MTHDTIPTPPLTEPAPPPVPEREHKRGPVLPACWTQTLRRFRDLQDGWQS